MKRFFLMVLLAAGAVAQDGSLAERAKAAVSVIQGTIKVPGVQKPVRVLRDRWGVAHIYAKNQHDLFFAQGYVVSQDRLFQMELWKRTGQGRLAEVLGPEALGRDRYARLLRYRGDMQTEYASYSPDAKEILEAFPAESTHTSPAVQTQDYRLSFKSPDSNRSRGSRKTA